MRLCGVNVCMFVGCTFLPDYSVTRWVRSGSGCVRCVFLLGFLVLWCVYVCSVCMCVCLLNLVCMCVFGVCLALDVLCQRGSMSGACCGV